MEGMDERRKSLHTALLAALAAADWERERAKNRQKLKTTASAPVAPQDVAALKRKPGAQPGNANALRSGYHSAEQKAQRRCLRGIKRRTRAAVATVNGFVRQWNEEDARLAAPPGGPETAP